MMISFTTVFVSLLAVASAVPTSLELESRGLESRAASCTFPSPPSTSSLSSPKTIAAGQSFDVGFMLL
jgi:pectate lyase